MNDISKTIEPKSDQLNADDLISGPRTITVTGIKLDQASGPQPVAIAFEGDNGKPYKPCKSMRRVMVQVWGKDGNGYVGRSMTLYLDPKVKFGGMEVGGIRISHMSDINEKMAFALTASRARRVSFVVHPLANQKQREPEPELDFNMIVSVAEMAAEQGMKAYLEFWTNQPPAAKAYLVESGDHELFKAKAENHDAPPKSEDDGT